MAIQELRTPTLRSAHTRVHRAEKFTVAGHELRMVALPAAYVADLQEACKLMGICESLPMGAL